jgi:serine/threonine protein kinase
MSQGMRIGKFQVLGQLGTGAHSTILHVRRAEDGKSYALKVVPIGGPEDQKYLDQAQHEFRVAGLLDHPALIKVYALEVEKDWLFRPRKAQLLIEYVNGKTLDAVPPLRLPVLVQVFERVASGLVHMHRRGVYHGDLKPNNILVSRGGGEVKVIDYGLAAVKGEERERIRGTPEYMAPEQVKQKVINEKTDLYNLGATMYRMLTFRLPPSVLTDDAGVPADRHNWDKLLRPVSDFNAAAPAALSELVQRCLAFHPAQRPERASEVQGALDRIAEQLVRSDADRLEALEW